MTKRKRKWAFKPYNEANRIRTIRWRKKHPDRYCWIQAKCNIKKLLIDYGYSLKQIKELAENILAKGY